MSENLAIARMEHLDFQTRVMAWLMECFDEQSIYSHSVRNQHFLEESLELVQACGGTAETAHQLVDYVFNRPIGERKQEIGGVLVTLTALCSAHDIDMMEEGKIELLRICDNVDNIRERQLLKPNFTS